MLHHNRFPRGMTLIEMLVTLAIVLLVVTTASDAVLTLYRTNGAGTRAASQLGSARYALATILEDMRAIAYGNDGSYPIRSMATSSITFFSNIPDSAGAMQVQYQISGAKLIRTQINPSTPPAYTGSPITSTLTTDIHNAADSISLFRYYDKNGIEITDMSRVTAVASIYVSIDILAPGMTTPFLLAATTTLRNLRSL